ncbi:methionyl-tRNA formyltransferase [Methanolobus vulcani]|uniref:methionyl-tRNA formyltransferase n=1 Tax=Methanolobus vulcani TaxID=38026 RepID=A0A7Z7AXL5_9EURY|nr:methionyl-tRNA formyltransferase [Methanolobus vulcani]SDF24719.1 methionyl-tRNA formyltransferase [Methanolobus vulcani]
MDIGLIILSKYNYKVVFFGNNADVLNHLCTLVDVSAVFTRPDDGSDNLKSIFELTHSLNIPLFQPSKKELSNYSPYLNQNKLDFIIVCGYKYIIPPTIFNTPKYGTVNIHPSLLPQYRGQHVINWAIINGEQETGITLHLMDENLDTGDILLQTKVPILFDDTAKDLHDRLYQKASELLTTFFTRFNDEGSISPKIQDSSQATFFKPRKPCDGHIEWDKEGEQIYNLVRAISKPWPGAFTYHNSSKIVVWRVSFEPHNSEESYGRIINVSNSQLIVNAKNSLVIIEDYDVFDLNNELVQVEFKEGYLLE